MTCLRAVCWNIRIYNLVLRPFAALVFVKRYDVSGATLLSVARRLIVPVMKAEDQLRRMWTQPIVLPFFSKILIKMIYLTLAR